MSNKDVKNYLKILDILMITSYTESFCISALEAAAIGLNVVANDVGGVSEVLPDAFLELSENIIVENF